MVADDGSVGVMCDDDGVPEVPLPRPPQRRRRDVREVKSWKWTPPGDGGAETDGRMGGGRKSGAAGDGAA